LDEAEATSLKAAWEGMAPTPNHEASIGIYPAIAPTRLVVSDIAGGVFWHAGLSASVPSCPYLLHFCKYPLGGFNAHRHVE